MDNKKSAIEIQVLLVWALIIGIGIVLLIIIGKTTGVGQDALAKIKQILPFV